MPMIVEQSQTEPQNLDHFFFSFILFTPRNERFVSGPSWRRSIMLQLQWSKTMIHTQEVIKKKALWDVSLQIISFPIMKDYTIWSQFAQESSGGLKVISGAYFTDRFHLFSQMRVTPALIPQRKQLLESRRETKIQKWVLHSAVSINSVIAPPWTLCIHSRHIKQ